MKKKFSKIFGVGLTIALVASLLLIAAPVGATSGTVTPARYGVSGTYLSGELTMVVDYAGAGTPTELEMDIGGPWPLLGDPLPLGPFVLQANFAANEIDPYDGLNMDLAEQLGLVSVDYDATEMKWTIVFDTTKKCEVCDDILIDLYDFMPGQEVWFDGTYEWSVFKVKCSNSGDNWDILDGPTPYTLRFDNPEDITPNLGLDAKGAEQWFWLNYVDVIDGVPLPCQDGCDVGPADGWVWAFVPGVNLETWGDVASPFDVIVEEGGRPYQDSFGTWHPAPCVGGVCVPDRYIHIWSRAPELGDCEVKVFLADLPADCAPPTTICEPIEICDEVASAEKKWGELNFSKLDVHIDLSDVDGKPTWAELKAAIEADFGLGFDDDFVKWVDEDHEIDVSAGTCTWDALTKKWDCTDGEKVHEKIAEWVWCDFLQLPEMHPAGGALVHWWLAEDSEANQIWIQDLMDEIVARSAGEGGRGHDLHAPDSNDYWSATGDYEPGFHPRDIIMDWIDPLGTLNDKFATATDIREFLPSCCCDPYLCKSTPMGDAPFLYPNTPYSWYGRSLTMDHIPGEIPGVSIAHLVNYAAEDVLIITLVEYQEDYNGENLILIEIGKKHFRTPPPPVQVKIPQVRWAGEKIVLEKDWGEGYAGNFCTFTIDQDSIGALVPVLPGDVGWGDYVETCVMEDGVARVIFESEYEGQAEVKCVLYDCDCYYSGGNPVEAQNSGGGNGCQAIGNHDFPLFYLKLESIEPLDDTPEPVDPFEDAYFGVQVKGWFWSKTTEKSGRPEKWIDIDPLNDSLPNVINGGNGIPDDDHDQYFPAGRWVLPDDWPTLAGIYELRRHWDLMNNWEDQAIWSAISPVGPFNSAVVTTAFPGLAEAPVIGPFNTTQPVAIEDEVIKWVTTASVWADYLVAFPATFRPVLAPPVTLLPGLAGSNDWTVADLRNTVVPDGKIEWFDCPMSPAKVIFKVAEGRIPDADDLFSAWKLWDIEDYFDPVTGLWFAPYYFEEIPSSWFIPMGGLPEGYNWDSWGMWSANLWDDGPYPFWLDLGLTTTVPATDDEVLEVYSDNNGIAYVGMNALFTAGEVRISALVDYPYQRKHTALRSEEVTQVWGPIELNPHFLAEETVVLVDELVTFTNETAGGTHPYVRAAWDFDGDGIAEIVIEDPVEAVVMQDVEWAYEFPGLYSVILTMTDSTPTTRWEERPDYITVTGEGARKGDFTGDGHITFEDFVDFAGCYGCVLGDVCYNVIGDFNDDGIIDFLDFVDFAAVYGT